MGISFQTDFLIASQQRQQCPGRRRRKSRYGLETICGGGGQGIAAVVARQ